MENERIDFFIKTLAELSAFLVKIKVRNAEMQEQGRLSKAVEEYLDGFNFSTLNVETTAPMRNGDALQLNLNERDNVMAENGYVEFNEKEIYSMPKNIKRIIIMQKLRCRLRTRTSGKNSFVYEIRLRKDGYNISACGKTIDLAKLNFLTKLKTAQVKDEAQSSSTSLSAFATYYFKNFYQPKVSSDTFKSYMTVYSNHILPALGMRQLTSITPLNVKLLFDKVLAQGKGRTVEDIRTLLNLLFKGAIAHGITSINPVDTVFYVKHQRQTGNVLTKETERQLIPKLKTNPLGKFIAIYLFTGLRRNELYKFTINDDFIIAVNSKRKNGQIEHKRIPIIAALRPFVRDGIGTLPPENKLREYFKALLPNHTIKDLRKTFNTRCKEFGVSDHARKHFMGHSLGPVDGTYTDLSDEYLLKEAKKLDEWNP